MFLENHHQPWKEDLHLHLRDLSLLRGLLFDDIHGAELMSEEAIYKSPERPHMLNSWKKSPK